MPKIHQLPDDLANQIAAGEVVERPASVVKELVENAIDAGARRVAVTVEYGGKRVIRVEDDGEGMEPADVRTALARHATSKIGSADDLEGIATLGFRGEALPSIASVSHFVLRSRQAGSELGTELRVTGGAITSEAPVGMPPGTAVEVGQLFFNLPARRKFLKSDAAESAQVSRVVTQFALCYPELGFALTSAGRTVLQCPPVGAFHERLYQIYGDRPDLVEVRRETGSVRVTGYVAALAEQGLKRGPQHVFVNRRIVKDKTIAHAIIEAYSAASIKERSPEVHLFLEMPVDAVDVNVHPTKAEVRFRDQSHVHQVVRHAVADALGDAATPGLRLAGPAAPHAAPATLPLPHAYAAVAQSRWGRATGVGAGRVDEDRFQWPSQVRDIAPPAAETNAPVARPLMLLGQFRDTFIIAVDEEGIAIIDQHVAHERVLYERISERLTRGALESQRLLEPLVLGFPPEGREALVAHAADLDRLGFAVDEFGGTALRVSAVPVLLTRERAEATLRALAADLEGLDRGSVATEALHHSAATMACHAAVKANDPLTVEKMTHLLEELRRTAYSTVCPHGRPVMLRLTRREVEKGFQRI